MSEVIDAHIVDDDGLTVHDEHGASLVFERWDGDQFSAWIAAPGESDGRSVRLSLDDRRRIAEYLLGGQS